MPSLILEGGTLRPIFSAGVMDALLDNNITFPYCIGVSAGITNGVSYISKQKGRNLEVVTKYRNDNRYLSYRNFLRCKSIFGLDFVFDEIPNNLIPFDMDTYRKYPGKVLVGVTNAHTGKTEYLNGKDLDDKCKYCNSKNVRELKRGKAVNIIGDKNKARFLRYKDGKVSVILYTEDKQKIIKDFEIEKIKKIL